MTALDYARFEALTFDCYGTLIDWEAGIVAGLRPAVARRGIEPSDDELLEVFAGFEAAAEAGPTRATATSSAAACARSPPTTRFEADENEVAAFSDSVGDWPAFPDSAASLSLPPRPLPARRDHQLR